MPFASSVHSTSLSTLQTISSNEFSTSPYVGGSFGFITPILHNTITQATTNAAILGLGVEASQLDTASQSKLQPPNHPAERQPPITSSIPILSILAALAAFAWVRFPNTRGVIALISFAVLIGFTTPSASAIDLPPTAGCCCGQASPRFAMNMDDPEVGCLTGANAETKRPLPSVDIQPGVRFLQELNEYCALNICPNLAQCGNGVLDMTEGEQCEVIGSATYYAINDESAQGNPDGSINCVQLNSDAFIDGTATCQSCQLNTDACSIRPVDSGCAGSGPDGTVQREVGEMCDPLASDQTWMCPNNPEGEAIYSCTNSCTCSYIGPSECGDGVINSAAGELCDPLLMGQSICGSDNTCNVWTEGAKYCDPVTCQLTCGNSQRDSSTWPPYTEECDPTCAGNDCPTCAGGQTCLRADQANYADGLLPCTCTGEATSIDGCLVSTILPCPNQRGVCSGAVKRCVSVSDTQNEFQNCDTDNLYVAHSSLYTGSSETICNDGEDNDCDGLVDTQDPDCALPSCSASTPCQSGDGCCPAGCSSDTDADCSATGACDEASYPTFCSEYNLCGTYRERSNTACDDGDPCTLPTSTICRPQSEGTTDLYCLPQSDLTAEQIYATPDATVSDGCCPPGADNYDFDESGALNTANDDIDCASVCTLANCQSDGICNPNCANPLYNHCDPDPDCCSELNSCIPGTNYYCADTGRSIPDCDTCSPCTTGICNIATGMCEEAACSAQAPAFTSEDISIIPGGTNGYFSAELSWRFTNGCLPTGFRVLRCSAAPGGTCNPLEGGFDLSITEVSAATTDNTWSHTDSSIEADITYCYSVEAGFSTSPPLVQESSPVCIGPFDSECLTRSTEFCDRENNKGVECITSGSNINTVADVDGKNCATLASVAATSTATAETGSGEAATPEGSRGLICSGPNPSGQVRCIEPGECDSCNGLFGQYGLVGLYKPTLDPVPLTNPLSVSSCFDQPSCYFDASHTSVSTFKSIAEITSCYDYKTRDACLADDRTGRAGATDSTTCEWHTDDGVLAQLGKGVCRPADETLLDCGACQEPFCSPSLCVLHGPCYYNEINGIFDHNPSPERKCLSQDEMACEFYNSQTDCDSDPLNMASLSHGRKICHWSTDLNRCFRDGNGDGSPDCLDPTDVDCLFSISPPQTNVQTPPHKVSPTLFNFPFSVYNDGTAGVQTFYCYAPSTCADATISTDPLHTCSEWQPQSCSTYSEAALTESRTGSFIALEDTPLQSGQFKDKQFTVFYYSMNAHGNQEPIQNFSVQLDNSFRIDFSQNQAPQEILGNYRSHVTLRISSHDDEPFSCSSFSFTPASGTTSIPAIATRMTEDGDTIEASPEELDETPIYVQYFEVPDGEYTFAWSCQDEVGNPSQNLLYQTYGEERLRLNADPNLPSYSTSKTTNQPVHTLFVETISPGECKLTDNDALSYDLLTPSNSYSMESNALGSSYNHTLEFNVDDYLSSVTSDTRSNPTTAALFIRCRVNTGTSTRDLGLGSSHVIALTKDTQPPIVNILYVDGGIEETLDVSNMDWRGRPNGNINLVCTDPGIVEPYSTGGFGCQDIQFCFGDGCTLSPSDTPTTTRTINRDSAPIMAQKVRYRAVDHGGNGNDDASIQEFYLKIDNVPPTGVIAEGVVDSGFQKTIVENRVVTNSPNFRASGRVLNTLYRGSSSSTPVASGFIDNSLVQYKLEAKLSITGETMFLNKELLRFAITQDGSYSSLRMNHTESDTGNSRYNLTLVRVENGIESQLSQRDFTNIDLSDISISISSLSAAAQVKVNNIMLAASTNSRGMIAIGDAAIAELASVLATTSPDLIQTPTSATIVTLNSIHIQDAARLFTEPNFRSELGPIRYQITPRGHPSDPDDFSDPVALTENNGFVIPPVELRPGGTLASAEDKSIHIMASDAAGNTAIDTIDIVYDIFGPVLSQFHMHRREFTTPAPNPHDSEVSTEPVESFLSVPSRTTDTHPGRDTYTIEIGHQHYINVTAHDDVTQKINRIQLQLLDQDAHLISQDFENLTSADSATGSSWTLDLSDLLEENNLSNTVATYFAKIIAFDAINNNASRDVVFVVNDTTLPTVEFTNESISTTDTSLTTAAFDWPGAPVLVPGKQYNVRISASEPLQSMKMRIASTTRISCGYDEITLEQVEDNAYQFSLNDEVLLSTTSPAGRCAWKDKDEQNLTITILATDLHGGTSETIFSPPSLATGVWEGFYRADHLAAGKVGIVASWNSPIAARAHSLPRGESNIVESEDTLYTRYTRFTTHGNLFDGTNALPNTNIDIYVSDEENTNLLKVNLREEISEQFVRISRATTSDDQTLSATDVLASEDGTSSILASGSIGSSRLSISSTFGLRSDATVSDASSLYLELASTSLPSLQFYDITSPADLTSHIPLSQPLLSNVENEAITFHTESLPHGSFTFTIDQATLPESWTKDTLYVYLVPKDSRGQPSTEFTAIKVSRDSVQPIVQVRNLANGDRVQQIDEVQLRLIDVNLDQSLAESLPEVTLQYLDDEDAGPVDIKAISTVTTNAEVVFNPIDYQVNFTLPTPITERGQYRLTVRTQDKAGNSRIQQKIVHIDPALQTPLLVAPQPTTSNKIFTRSGEPVTFGLLERTGVRRAPLRIHLPSSEITNRDEMERPLGEVYAPTFQNNSYEGSAEFGTITLTSYDTETNELFYSASSNPFAESAPDTYLFVPHTPDSTTHGFYNSQTLKLFQVRSASFNAATSTGRLTIVGSTQLPADPSGKTAHLLLGDQVPGLATITKSDLSSGAHRIYTSALTPDQSFLECTPSWVTSGTSCGNMYRDTGNWVIVDGLRPIVVFNSQNPFNSGAVISDTISQLRAVVIDDQMVHGSLNFSSAEWNITLTKPDGSTSTATLGCGSGITCDLSSRLLTVPASVLGDMLDPSDSSTLGEGSYNMIISIDDYVGNTGSRIVTFARSNGPLSPTISLQGSGSTREVSSQIFTNINGFAIQLDYSNNDLPVTITSVRNVASDESVTIPTGAGNIFSIPASSIRSNSLSQNANLQFEVNSSFVANPDAVTSNYVNITYDSLYPVVSISGESTASSADFSTVQTIAVNDHNLADDQPAFSGDVQSAIVRSGTDLAAGLNYSISFNDASSSDVPIDGAKSISVEACDKVAQCETTIKNVLLDTQPPTVSCTHSSSSWQNSSLVLSIEGCANGATTCSNPTLATITKAIRLSDEGVDSFRISTSSLTETPGNWRVDTTQATGSGHVNIDLEYDRVQGLIPETVTEFFFQAADPDGVAVSFPAGIMGTQVPGETRYILTNDAGQPPSIGLLREIGIRLTLNRDVAQGRNPVVSDIGLVVQQTSAAQTIPWTYSDQAIGATVSGFNQLTYCLSSTATCSSFSQVPNSGITLDESNANGINLILKSRDNAHLQSPDASCLVQIDQSAPSAQAVALNYTEGASDGGPVNFTFVMDGCGTNEAPCLYVEYCFSNSAEQNCLVEPSLRLEHNGVENFVGSWHVGDNIVQRDQPGNVFVHFSAVDAAGNKAIANHFNINIDQTAPDISDIIISTLESGKSVVGATETQPTKSNSRQIIVQGTTEPYANVQLVIDPINALADELEIIENSSLLSDNIPVDEAGVISIPFTLPSNGESTLYRLTITSTDGAGNVGQTTTQLLVVDHGPNIQQVDRDVFSSAPLTLHFNTVGGQGCSYIPLYKPALTPIEIHPTSVTSLRNNFVIEVPAADAPLLPARTQPYVIEATCIDDFGSNMTQSIEFYIDNQPPIFTLEVDGIAQDTIASQYTIRHPVVITTPTSNEVVARATLKAQTLSTTLLPDPHPKLDSVTCRYDRTINNGNLDRESIQFGTSYANISQNHIDQYMMDSDPTRIQNGVYDYQVTCTDLAGQTATQSIRVVIDITEFMSVVQKAPIATTTDSAQLRIETNVPARSCTSRNVATGILQSMEPISGSKYLFAIDYAGLNSGQNTFNVTCSADDPGDNPRVAVATMHLTVDQTAPQIPTGALFLNGRPLISGVNPINDHSPTLGLQIGALDIDTSTHITDGGGANNNGTWPLTATLIGPTGTSYIATKTIDWQSTSQRINFASIPTRSNGTYLDWTLEITDQAGNTQSTIVQIHSDNSSSASPTFNSAMLFTNSNLVPPIDGVVYGEKYITNISIFSDSGVYQSSNKSTSSPSQSAVDFTVNDVTINPTPSSPSQFQYYATASDAFGNAPSVHSSPFVVYFENRAPSLISPSHPSGTTGCQVNALHATIRPEHGLNLEESQTSVTLTRTDTEEEIPINSIAHTELLDINAYGVTATLVDTLAPGNYNVNIATTDQIGNTGASSYQFNVVSEGCIDLCVDTSCSFFSASWNLHCPSGSTQSCYTSASSIVLAGTSTGTNDAIVTTVTQSGVQTTDTNTIASDDTFEVPIIIGVDGTTSVQVATTSNAGSGVSNILHVIRDTTLPTLRSQLIHNNNQIANGETIDSLRVLLQIEIVEENLKTISYAVNGTSHPLPEPVGSYLSSYIDLLPGLNEVVITAEDMVGHISNQTLYVRTDVNGPLITINNAMYETYQPGSPARTSSTQVRLQGTYLEDNPHSIYVSINGAAVEATIDQQPQSFDIVADLHHSDQNIHLNEIRVWLEDDFGNAVYDSTQIEVDKTSPKISWGAPELYGSAIFTNSLPVPLQFTTSENATCELGSTSGLPVLPRNIGTAKTIFNHNYNDATGLPLTITCEDSFSHQGSKQLQINLDQQPPIVSSFRLLNQYALLQASSARSKSYTVVAGSHASFEVVGNEPLMCKYFTNPDADFSTGSTFENIGQTTIVGNVALTQGAETTYHIKCRDLAGNDMVGDPIQFNITLDVNQPMLMSDLYIESDAGLKRRDGERINDPTPRVRVVTVQPAQSCRLQGQGEDAAFNVLMSGSNTAFVYQLPLQTSNTPHTYTVTCENAALGLTGSKQAQQSITFEIKPEMALDITSPVNGEHLINSKIAVAGTGDPGVNVELTVHHGDLIQDQGIRTINASGAFQVPGVVLGRGINTVTAVGSDDAGNVRTQQISLNYTSNGPRLAILTKIDNNPWVGEFVSKLRVRQINSIQIKFTEPDGYDADGDRMPDYWEEREFGGSVEPNAPYTESLTFLEHFIANEGLNVTTTEVSLRDTSGQVVPATIDRDAASRTITISPESTLTLSERYELIVVEKDHQGDDGESRFLTIYVDPKTPIIHVESLDILERNIVTNPNVLFRGYVDPAAHSVNITIGDTTRELILSAREDGRTSFSYPHILNQRLNPFVITATNIDAETGDEVTGQREGVLVLDREAPRPVRTEIS